MKKPVLIFCVIFLLLEFITGYFQVAAATEDDGDNVNEVEEFLDLDKYNSKKLNLEQRDSEENTSLNKKKVPFNSPLKKFYNDDYDPCEEKLKKYKSLNKSIDDYIQRYLNLFLRISLLKDYYVNSADEIISVNFEISVTGEDLAFLQEYSNLSSVPVEKILSKLDAIMMNILKKKKKTIMERNFDWINTISESFLSIFNFEFFNIFILVLLTLIILLLVVKKFFLSSISLFIAIVINIIVIFEGWWTYKKKLKEKEVEFYVNALNQKEIPADCDPSKITWYKTWYNYFFGSDCLHYFLNVNKDSRDEVSMYQCIYDTYALYFIQKPFNFFGQAIGEFSKQLTDSLPQPFKLFFFIPVIFFTVFITILFILILFGNGLKISIFGSSFEVGKVRSSGQTLPFLSSSQRQSQFSLATNSGTRTLKGYVSKPRKKIKRVFVEQTPKKLIYITEE